MGTCMDRTARVQYLAMAVGVVAASLLVWQTSGAVFTSTTENAGNSFAAGTVTLTDDDLDSALFSYSGWVPTDTATNCVEVTYAGTAEPGGAVDFYAAHTDVTVNGDGLGEDLDVTVELGAAGATCASFSAASTLYTTAALDTLASSASPITTGWTPVLSSDVMRPFRITVTLGSDTANDAQGESSTATFTWAVSS